MAYRSLVLSILTILPLVFVYPANAHAILLSATPGMRKDTRGPDVPIKLRFNSRVDGKRSRLTLIAPNGELSALPIDEQPSPDTLTSQGKGLKSGSYIIRWQVLANDGHITRGELPFRVQ
jgi:methionine-rich copper-binding protein CopC